MRFPHYALSEFQAQNNPRARSRLGAASLELKRVDELLALATPAQQTQWERLTLSYAPERGAIELRTAIAENYPGLDATHILVFSSATEALFCALHAAVEPQHRCTAITPCYEPLAKIPESIGAQVSSVALQRKLVAGQSRWVLDSDEIEAAAGESDLLCINFPHNPTGAMISETQLQSLAESCEAQGTRLLSDEVFRGLEHDPSTTLTPAACLGSRNISVGSIAKPHGVGGVRIGWIACQDSQLLDRAVAIRRTLSVCSGTTDEWLATLVLEHSQTLRDAARTRLIANCRLIASSAEQLGERFLWTAPQAGCAAFPLLKDDSSSLAETIIEDTGIMLIPSQCFWLGDSQGLTNGVRLGYGLSDFTEVWPRFAAYLND